jgi:hypothetical protein
MSDMLAETNRVREEKKDALDAAQREAMKYISETPNGEHVGARESILEFSDQVSNRMRIADQLLKSGQINPKQYTIFRQNVLDNTNLAFNANKAYQENYGEIMQRARDGISSGLELNNAEEVEGFGDWRNIGWEIAPNGVIMAGKMTEQDINGKKVRALDKTPGGLRSMDYLNQAILGKIDKYDYESQVNSWVKTLGKEKKTIVQLGKIQKQGKITSVEDITSRKDIDPATKQVLFDFIQAENDIIKQIAGTNLDSARLLYDNAKIAPNGKPYIITTNPTEAKQGVNYILKEVDPDTGGFKYALTNDQKKDAEEFIRTQARAKYNYEEEAQVVGQVSRDEPRPQTPKPEPDKDKAAADKKAADTANMLGKLWYGDTSQVNSAISYFKGMKDKKNNLLFREINRTPEGIEVFMFNGNKETIKFKNENNQTISQEDFIRAAGPLLANQVDVNTALDKGSYQKGASFNQGSKGSSKTETANDRYRKHILSKIKPDIVGKTEGDAIAVISRLASMGGLVAEESTAGGDYITIKVPGTEAGTYIDEKEFSFDEDRDNWQDIYEDIVDFMVNNASVNAINNSLKPSSKPAANTGTIKGGKPR